MFLLILDWPIITSGCDLWMDSHLLHASRLGLPAEGLVLSNLTLSNPMYHAFAFQVGRVDRLFAHRRTLGIMVKIRDQAVGGIGPHWADNTLQAADRERFQSGTALAWRILAGRAMCSRAGTSSPPPGGSLAVGCGGPVAVDGDLRTVTPGLYVGDASVLPVPRRLKPALTLLALGKCLARVLRS